MKKIFILLAFALASIQAVQAVLVIMPNAYTLTSFLQSKGLSHFEAKTGVVAELAGKKLPMDEVAKIVDAALDSYTKDKVLNLIMKEKRSQIINTFLEPSYVVIEASELPKKNDPS